MRSLFENILVFVLLLAVGIDGAAAQTASLPELSIPEAVYNFGEVVQGTKVEHQFEIANLGQAPLVIKAVQPGCGCTGAVAGKTTLEPGEKTEISASFDTTGFQGYKVKTIRLHTNDPKQSSAVIGFQGSVKMDVELSQVRVFFGTVKKGEALAKEVTVKPGTDTSVKILEVNPKSEFLNVVSQDVSGGGQKLTVSLKDNVPVGVFKSRIVVKTTSGRNPVISIPVFARVEGDLRFTPSDVSFGLIEGPIAKPISQRLKLVNSGEKPIQVLSVKSSNPAVEVSLEKVTPGKLYELTVSVVSGSLGPLRGQITVTTDHPSPDQSELTLPVYGIIARRGQ